MKRSVLLGVVVAALGFGRPVHAAWQIDQSNYNNWLCSSGMAVAACGQPPRIGSFDTRMACENARRSGRLGRDTAWLSRTRCVGFDSQRAAPQETTRQPAEEPQAAPDREAQAASQKALFEAEKAEVLARLKGGAGDAAGAKPQESGLKPLPPSAPAGPSATAAGALRELECAASWALAAAREADGDAGEARLGAERSAQAHGARTGGCPPPSGPIPMPTPVIDNLPPPAETYRRIIEQAREIRMLLTRNRQKLAAMHVRRDQTAEKIARLKQEAQGRDKSDAERKAAEALAAAEKLEQELARLDDSIQQTRDEQKELLGKLDALEDRYRSASSQR